MDIVKLETNGNIWLAKANFTAFYPNDLPNDLAVDEITYRTENFDKNYPRCSLKLYIGDKSRKLSLKQFNYDWSPPAYDYPALWKNHTEFSNIDIPEPVPHLLGNSIFWIGFNYKNKRAASVTRDRTLIEFTVLEGAFTDQE
ncbi:hypothetical protein [Candidatus Tisiphia endosymbiont of Micropterix aruncella]|uniref:hypothetical protein n=1 Tax=Candidatus Tisiphia endosymbiont of Micropterix aruncella TaxID=3066271 RepID=UPI003AA84C55